MSVNRELIEKYHDGKCSPQEIALIEHWLNSSDASFATFANDDQKEEIKNEMWQEISAVLPSYRKKREQTITSRIVWWGSSAAASILICCAYLFLSGQERNKKTEFVTDASTTNNLETGNREVQVKDLTISLAPESNVRVNTSTGVVNFCGAMKISPTRDMQLSFRDVCADKSVDSGKMGFKKGETYIAVNLSNEDKNELIIMNENSLMELPPMLKRQLMDQFNI